MSQRKHNYEDWIWSMRVLAAGAARRGRTLIVFLAGAAIFALGLVVTFGLVSGRRRARSRTRRAAGRQRDPA